MMTTPDDKKNPDELLLIRRADAQAILNYLGECPAKHVFNLVGIMLNLQIAPTVDAMVTAAVEGLPPGVTGAPEKS